MSDKHCPLLFSHHHHHHSAFVKNDPRSKKATTEDCNLEHSCHPRPAQFHYFPWWAFYNFTICNKTNLDPNPGHWHEYGSKMEKIHAFFDTLSTVFHRWKFLAMWNAVFRGRGAVSRSFSRVFDEEVLWAPVGRWWWLEQSRDKSGFASLRVLQYGQLKISRKKRKPVRNACQSGGAACDLAKCDLSTQNHALAPYLEPYIRQITAAPLTKLCTTIQI